MIYRKMSSSSLLCLLLFSLVSTGYTATGDVTKLQIGVKHKPATCSRKAKAGDSVSVHYTVWVCWNPTAAAVH